MEDQNLEKRIKALEDEFQSLKTRRVFQYDMPPDIVKQRHIGEGVKFVRAGTATNRPTTPETPQTGVSIYFATDTAVLSIGSGSVWYELKLPASTTNYTISNLTTDRTYDADATSTAELADILGTLLTDLGLT